jgi:hypothetical protein
MARTCKECGGSIKPSRQRPVFCCAACRLRFNNRRMERGAQLYDLFMSMRYERDVAADLGVWAIMCRIAKEFREQDDREREGRKSWQPPAQVIERLPVVMAQKDVTIIYDRTGRGAIRSAAGA